MIGHDNIHCLFMRAITIWNFKSDPINKCFQHSKSMFVQKRGIKKLSITARLTGLSRRHFPKSYLGQTSKHIFFTVFKWNFYRRRSRSTIKAQQKLYRLFIPDKRPKDRDIAPFSLADVKIKRCNNSTPTRSASGSVSDLKSCKGLLWEWVSGVDANSRKKPRNAESSRRILTI